MGGEAELSTAIPSGEYNSRPSTRLGLPDSAISVGWPIARAGTGFSVTCGKAGLVPNNVRSRRKVCLNLIVVPAEAARHGKRTLVSRIPNTGGPTNIRWYCPGRHCRVLSSYDPFPWL